MDFDAKTIIVKDLLSNGRQYFIPRYQREYSWDTPQLTDFYNDIINNISPHTGGGLQSNAYFFGTLILIGDMALYQQPLEIVDGQQRITTFTIALSALSDLSHDYEENISNNIWKYVVGADDNGVEYTVLDNNTAFPYFQDKIQKRLLNGPIYEKNRLAVLTYEEEEQTTEEKSIKNAYDFFMKSFSEDSLRKIFPKNNSTPYIEIIKTIRDQILNSQLIYICSKNGGYVNTIFENINSKGKQLSRLDLIKNEIFSKETTTVPKDDAKVCWINISKNLCNNGVYISNDTFFRHYWLTKYSQSTEDQLHDNFLKLVKKEDYYAFLQDLEKSSKDYHDLMNPNVALFRVSPKGGNISKADAEKLVSSINTINNLFNVKQSQIILLPVYQKYLDNSLNFKQLRTFSKFLEEFHFIYNAVCKMPTNRLETRYGKFARSINKLEDKTKITNEIEMFKKSIVKILPAEDVFMEKFEKLIFTNRTTTKSQKTMNSITKYAIAKYEEFSSTNGEYDKIRASIEHIIPENSNEDSAKTIGNLILLEEDLNQEAKDFNLGQKINIFKKSNYQSVKNFIKNYPTSTKTFGANEVEKRTKEIGTFLLEKIIQNTQNQ